MFVPWRFKPRATMVSVSNRFQIVLCSLILLVVLFTFVAPTLNLQETALRSKQSADSIFLGLVLLAMTIVGVLRLRSLLASHSPAFLGPPAVVRRLCEPEVSCSFRC